MSETSAQLRDENGRFIKSSTGVTYSTTPLSKEEVKSQTDSYSLTKNRTDPPLLFLKVSNPVTYIKRWWKRLMGNEGVEFRLRIKPLTAIAIAMALGLFGFGVGRVSVPIDSPIVKYIPQLAPLPTVNPWKVTAFSGTLYSANGSFYLITAESEAVTLLLPSNLDLTKYIGKRILVKGSYNENQRILKIANPEDVELLSTKPQRLPTSIPSPTAAPVPTDTPFPTTTPEESSPNPIF